MPLGKLLGCPHGMPTGMLLGMPARMPRGILLGMTQRVRLGKLLRASRGKFRGMCLLLAIELKSHFPRILLGMCWLLTVKSRSRISLGMPVRILRALPLRLILGCSQECLLEASL